MLTPASIRRLSLAAWLTLHSAAVAADSPWQCDSNPGGLWDCASRATAVEPNAPATVAAPPPGNLTDEPIADEQIATEPAETGGALLLPAATTVPERDTPLFPITAPETTAPAIEPDSPAVPAPPAPEPPATAPVSGAASELPDTAAAYSTSQSANEVTAEITTVATTTALDATTDSGDATLDEEIGLSRWALCPPVQYRSVDTPTSETGAVELQADNAQARDNNIFILEGNAVAQMDWQRLEADNLTYTQDEGRIDAAGNVIYTSPELLVDGDRGTLYPDTDTGDIEQASYALPEQHARGIASSMELDGRDYQHLKDVSYTTCPVNSTDWEIFAEQVDLDQEEGRGVARNAKVELKGVPVLWTPWLSFPLDDRRKSGLLVPSFGITEETGVDISTPYY